MYSEWSARLGSHFEDAGWKYKTSGYACHVVMCVTYNNVLEHCPWMLKLYQYAPITYVIALYIYSGGNKDH